jgi:CYTH domain-containing protein
MMIFTRGSDEECEKMGTEIERKYLLKNDTWRLLARGTIYRQGYLNRTKECTVRVRTTGAGGYLTIKGYSKGATRVEYEYDIPESDAASLLHDFCLKPLIEKRRYKIEFAGLVWDIDEFLGENTGLIVAEVELEREDQPFEKPEWIGQEVTGDPKYYNANLVAHPYCTW